MRIKKYLPALCLGAVALVFTLLVKLVDVQPAGVNGSSLGFAGLNTAVHQRVGVSLSWYQISQILGYLGILLAVTLAFLGLWQWIRRKDLRQVDRAFFGLAALYILLVILWVAFDKLALNLRPVLENGVAEPSYPSTHTMMGLIFFGSGVIMALHYLPAGWARRVTVLLGIAAAAVLVIARFLAGVHWLTDIIGGLLISAAMLLWFYRFIKGTEKTAQ